MLEERNIEELENKSIYIIREAAAQFKNLGILWSMGKDATVLLYLIRKAFLGKVPFTVVHIDTGHKFPEMYAMRDKYKEDWNLNLIVENARYVKDPDLHREQCGEIKAEAIRATIKKNSFDAIFVGIRKDEHVLRNKERIFSPRDIQFKWNYTSAPLEMWDTFNNALQPGEHMRIHPLLNWSEVDIWKYIEKENIPVNPLYFSKKGERFRSLGCIPCTKSFSSTASNIGEIIEELKVSQSSERGGRLSSREQLEVMQRLRAMGYF
tara:strand:+ start:119 stop:913 length:795 start_codon:yes stop_codon:yes gene_type:complete